MEYFYSIIIPAWNVEKYIEKCIRSCLFGDETLAELIVINDGSTDNTLEIAERFAGQYKNIKVISTENRGLSAARNTGMEYARGEYVIFLDSDDWFTSEVKEYLQEKDTLQGVDVLFYRVQNVSSGNEQAIAQKVYPFEEEKMYSGKEIFDICKKEFVPHEAWRGIYRRKFLLENEIVFLPNIIYEDVPFWFQIVRNAEKIKYTNKIFYNCLHREGSITHSKIKWNNIASIFSIATDILSNTETDTAYLSVAARKITDTMMFCEKNIRTAEQETLLTYKMELLIRKKEIVNLILQKYDSSDNQLKMKYVLVSNFVTFLGIYDDELIGLAITLRNEIISALQTMMQGWLFKGADKKIGVYGSGKNSDVIIDTYERLYGPITAEYLYIDSYKYAGDGKRHFNHPMINVREIQDNAIDKILVASNLYENIMTENLSGYVDKGDIYTVYKENDFSLDGVLSYNYMELFLQLKKTQNDKRILLLQTPEYSNLGDQLIAEAEKQFLQDYFGEYTVIEVTNAEYEQYKTRLKAEIKDDDILMITGGGYFGSLWTESAYDNVIDIVMGYPYNPIWIMPVSVYFEENEKGVRYRELTRELFSRNNIKICLRENYSLECCKYMGIKAGQMLLCPDIALYYRDAIKQTGQRKGCAFVFRDDKERTFSTISKNQIKKYMCEKGFETIESSMLYDTQIIVSQRRAAVWEKLQEIMRYELVITDRLHCMIMCVLTHTPCLAFDNVSHKGKGVYEWIKHLDYIKLVDKESDIEYFLSELSKRGKDLSSNSELEYDWDKIADFFIGKEE